MGTAILRSHDCLQRRFLPNDALSIPSSHLRSRRNSNHNPNSNQNRRRKRSPVANVHANHHDRRQSVDRSDTPAKSTAASTTSTTSNLVMGQVKILKRGEKLIPEIPISHGEISVPVENHKVRVTNDVDLILGTTDRFGPDAVTMQKQIRVSESKDGIYAGSAFASSPPPSSVPVPFFLGKNGSATNNLIRLLRLNLDD